MLYQQWLRNAQKFEDRRENLLSDYSKLDREVADVAQQYSPSPKKFNMRGAETRIEAVEKSIPDDHPMKGFTPELEAAYKKALQNPENLAEDPKQVLHELAFKIASPRIEPSMEYKRQADSSLSNFFGIFGEDKKSIYDIKAF